MLSRTIFSSTRLANTTLSRKMSGIYSQTVSHLWMSESVVLKPTQVELPKSTIDLAEYKDKTLLFVNVASKCGELVLDISRLFFVMRGTYFPRAAVRSLPAGFELSRPESCGPLAGTNSSELYERHHTLSED